MEMIPDSIISNALNGLAGTSGEAMQVDQADTPPNAATLPHRYTSAGEESLQETPSIGATASGENQPNSGPAAGADLAPAYSLKGTGSDQNLQEATQKDNSSSGIVAAVLSPQSGEMGPPTAPASMLYTIRASDTAKKGSEQNDDPYICSHLAAVAVTLFRMGKAKESKAVGQFAVNLLGEERWHEWLLKYMNAPEEEDAEKWALPLLSDVATALRVEDPGASGFLSILVELME